MATHKHKTTFAQWSAGKTGSAKMHVLAGVIRSEISVVKDILDGMLTIPTSDIDERGKTVIFVDLTRAWGKLLVIEELALLIPTDMCNQVYVQTNRLKKLIQFMEDTFHVGWTKY